MNKLSTAVALLMLVGTALLAGCEAARPGPGEVMVEMAVPTGDMHTSMAHIEKTGPKEVLAGKEFRYNVVFTSLIGSEIVNPVITETLSPGFNVTGTIPEAAISANKVVWSVGKVEACGSRTLTVIAVADTTGPIETCTEVSFKEPVICLAMSAVKPDLRVAKSAPSDAILCDTIDYTIVVTNVGTGVARNVQIRDALPAGMKSVDGQDIMTHAVGDLGPNQSQEMTFRAKVDKPGRYLNMATAVADEGISAKCGEVETMVRTPALLVTKSGPEVRFVGRPITYTITVTNTGDADARNTVVQEVMAATTQFVSASHDGRRSGEKVVWELGTLAPNQKKQVSVTVRPGVIGEISSVAYASAYCAAGQAEARTQVKGVPAILLECIDVSDPIEVGANTTYVITVTNQGSAKETGIRVWCTIAPEQEFVSASGPTKETVEGRRVRFAPLSSLAPKERAVFRIVAKGVKTGDARFRMSLKTDQMATPVEESESTRVYR